MASREEREDEFEVDEETILLQGTDFEILGTSCAEKEGNVFVWCATEGVKLFDVEGRRCLLSLPPPKGRLGMVGVDRSHDLGCVFGITEGNEVCCWEVSLEKKQDSRPKSKLRKPLSLGKDKARTVALLSSPSSPLLFLVSRNGEISAFDLTSSKTRQVDSPSQQKIEVLDAKLITTNQTQKEATVKIFLVFQTSKSQIGVGVISLLLTDNGTSSTVLSRAHSSLIKPPSTSSSSSASSSTPNLKEKPRGGLARFSSFTVNQEEEKVSLCWSNGQLQLFSYLSEGDSFSLTEKFSQHITCYEALAASAPVQSTKRKRKSASVAVVSPPSFSSSPLFSFQLNPSFLAVFGQAKNRHILTIWETAHGTLSSSRTVSSPRSSSAPLFVSSHRKSDFVTISFSNSVLVVPVSVPKKSRLSEVIGKAHTTLPFLASESQGRFLEAPLSSNVRISPAICNSFDGAGFENYTKALGTREEEEQRVIKLLTDRKATPTAADFTKIFSQYAESIVILGKKDINLKTAKRPITPSTNMTHHYRVEMKTKVHNSRLQRGAHDDPAFSFNFLHQVMGRCLQECSEQNSDFWEPVQTFVKSHYVYSRLLPQLIPLVIKQNQTEVLCDCLLYIHDISEVQLISVIKFVLEHHRTDDNAFVSESGKKATVEQRKEILLNLCIRRAVNSEFLRPAMSLLKEMEVALLLGFLKDKINGETSLQVDPEQETVFGVKHKVPKPDVVLEWVMALLDSQLSTILFSETCSSVLLDLSLMIREQVAVSKELNTIAGELWNVMNRREGTQQRQGAYSIQRIYL